MDITIPAPQGSTEPAASPVTTHVAEQSNTPQVEKPAGTPQADKPAGESTEQSKAASDENPSQEDQPKTHKEKRQERNRQRWQEYKAAKEIIPARLAVLEGEIARLKGAATPDFSGITDPTEELAERTAWKVRQGQATDAEARLKSEREAAAIEQQQKLGAAWQEAIEDAKERLHDFDAVVTSETPIHARAAPFIVESDMGPDIAYWLGKNKSAAEALYQKFETAPAQALIELGRIEARLSAPPAKTVSTAPRPAPTLGGGVNPLQFDAARASVGDMAAQLSKAGIIR